MLVTLKGVMFTVLNLLENIFLCDSILLKKMKGEFFYVN